MSRRCRRRRWHGWSWRCRWHGRRHHCHLPLLDWVGCGRRRCGLLCHKGTKLAHSWGTKCGTIPRLHYLHSRAKTAAHSIISETNCSLLVEPVHLTAEPPPRLDTNCRVVRVESSVCCGRFQEKEKKANADPRARLPALSFFSTLPQGGGIAHLLCARPSWVLGPIVEPTCNEQRPTHSRARLPALSPCVNRQYY